MDTITHTLFGIGLYKAINKENMNESEKRALLVTAIAGSQIPDIDVISKWWDTNGQYQMWHRGITHSIALVPVWAFLLTILNYIIFRVKSTHLFLIAALAVFIHDTSDVFNAWGTGYLEPFSNARLTLGTISIIDFVIWFIFLAVFLLSKRRKLQKEYQLYRIGWVVIVLHVIVQSVQGYVLYEQHKHDYDQLALSADFIPWHYTIIGKKDGTVEIISDSLVTEKQLKERLYSNEEADLSELFARNPKAKTLVEWSPFVVIEQTDERIGVYDPRFYRNGQSFLFEYMERNQP
ncbi:inner membrane protein [Bacillus ectoiniformans]|uniref:metal-dependent hydrolase n=1 Tax=Bacillus ectoiniformans TaxID=1494429 RepID=UPI00195EF37D|nr:metal-dependent hydrolase [Bacillus ectoiniformans]MBM7647764.1 inner membrane protein [Bacillus ectoiniformans]